MRRPRVADLRAPLGRVPRAAWVCAFIACLNAVCWSVITPPFQVPDEPAHFAYVQLLAENHALPNPADAEESEEEELALNDLHQEQVQWHPEVHVIASKAEQLHLEHDLAGHASRSGPGGAGVATAEPPLYYALETIPYLIGSGANLLVRLELMRLLSALMAGITAFFVFMFIREAVPGVRWAWTVGGLCVALAPLLGFMSGAVSSEAGLYAISAATFYTLARAFRRGFAPRIAVALGAVIAIGLLTKVNYVGLLPGLAVGLIMLTLQAARSSRARALRSLAIAAAIAVSPIAVYAISNLVRHHPLLGIVTNAVHMTTGRGPLLPEISYIWQSYLPRLPGMRHYFPGISTPIQMWFDRSVGFYGWNDTEFPVWVEHLALIPATVMALLCARALVAARGTLSSRLPELGVYAVMVLGILALIGGDSYLVPREAGTYSEPRYLMPLLALGGAAFALSARGAGRRWGPVVGALMVVLFLSHDVFSQLQVIARYYG